MSEGSRRRRAKAWAWVYLALFSDGDDATDTKKASTDQAEESTQETSNGSETR